MVFGRAAALRAAETVTPGERLPDAPRRATDKAVGRFERLRGSRGSRTGGEIRLEMQRVMQRHCAVFRDGRLLETGAANLACVAASMSDLAVADRSLIWNSELAENLELDNMLAQAKVSLHSAIGRTESRGAHFRDDYPKRDDENWLKHTLAWMDDAGDVRLGYRDVHLNPLSNDVASIPPKERVY